MSLDANDDGVNAAGVLYEWLTDKVTGRGLPDSALLQSSFEATAALIDDARISPYITTQQEFRSYVAQLFEYHGLWLRMTAGQLELGPWQRGNIDPASLPQVGSDDLMGEPDISPGTYDDCLTKVTVKFCDRALDFKEVNSEPYYNPHIFRIIGEPREVLLQRLWITKADLANRYAAEYGMMHSRISMSGTIQLKRERAKALGLHQPGGLFVLNWATRNLAIVMRNSKVSWPADRESAATLQVENERGLWPQLYVQPAAPKPGNFVVSVPAIANARIIELPSGLKDASATQIAVLAQRPSAAVLGFRTHVSADGGSTYDLIETDNNFAVFGKFTADYGSANPDNDTTVGLTVELFGVDTIATQSETEKDNNTLLLFAGGTEVMSVGQVAALGAGIFRVYVRRARFGTPKLDHVIANTAWFILREKLTRIENRNFVAGSTRSFKLQPFTQGTELTLSAISGTLAATSPFTFSSTPAVNSIANLALTTDWDKTEQDTVIARIGATWDAVTGQDIAGYEVGIKPSSAVAYQTRSVGAVLITEWNTLLPGVSYDVRVRAINEHGEPGLWSLPATITASAGLAKPTLDLPGGLKGSANESQSITEDRDVYFWAAAPAENYPYPTATGVMRYTTDGSDDTASSPIMAHGGHLSVSETVTVKCSIYSGTKAGPRRTVTYTRLVDTSVWTNLPPPYAYHDVTAPAGTRGATGYRMKLQSRSPIASVTMVSVDGGAFVVYNGAAIFMTENGSLEFYDDAPGVAFPSTHDFFYNVPATADPRYPPGTNVP